MYMGKADEKPTTNDKAIVAPKAKYFSPDLQASVEADSPEQATEVIEKELAERKKAADNEGTK